MENNTDNTPQIIDIQFDNVTRVEVVNSEGRVHSEWNCSEVMISLQDDRKTLKVFYKNVNPE